MSHFDFKKTFQTDSKETICRYAKQGLICLKGTNCEFSHDLQRNNNTNTSYPQNNTHENSNYESHRNKPQIDFEPKRDESTTKNFKTKLCRHFQLGKCKLGGLCNFSHGNEELSKKDAQTNNPFQRQTLIETQGGQSKIVELEKRLESFGIMQSEIIDKIKFLNQQKSTNHPSYSVYLKE